MQRTPEAVLRKQFGPSAQILTSIITRYMEQVPISLSQLTECGCAALFLASIPTRIHGPATHLKVREDTVAADIHAHAVSRR